MQKIAKRLVQIVFIELQMRIERGTNKGNEMKYNKYNVNK